LKSSEKVFYSKGILADRDKGVVLKATGHPQAMQSAAKVSPFLFFAGVNSDSMELFKDNIKFLVNTRMSKVI